MRASLTRGSNLGIAFKRDRDFARAAKQLRHMVKFVPADAASHYTLGGVFNAQERTETPQREFETASHLAPHLAGPHFQLYTAYRQAGRTKEAAREWQAIQEIQQRNEGAAIPEHLERCWRTRSSGLQPSVNSRAVFGRLAQPIQLLRCPKRQVSR